MPMYDYYEKKSGKKRFFIKEYAIKNLQLNEFGDYYLFDFYNEKMNNSVAFDLVPLHDRSGYLITGYMYTKSYADKYTKDMFVLKVNNELNLVKYKIFGGEKSDKGFKIIQTDDENYLVAGFSQSFHSKNGDGWIVKIDSDIDEKWGKIYPTNNAYNNEFLAIKKTYHNSYILSGYVKNNKTKRMRFIEIDPGGNIKQSLIIKSNKNEIAQDFILGKDTKNMIVSKFKSEYLMAVGYKQNSDRDILIYKRNIINNY